ncbi:zinc finger and BTB domain-containing protein 7B-like [Coregonus clupeaformis]|uniref:zinc finger and BTB domain-containing protein 7B-like n=1 Tax=Coregonus clupeaformis TaxID=59861 RepID=UPI001E1C952F|nr:zinc finger and BTB domain-containing protein 7B-like [Coregonus clupeaformis]
MSPGEDGLIGIPFPEHSSELLFRLNAQRRAGQLCDLTLTSRGARYPTHRSVMAAVSLYFRGLFGAEEGAEAGGGGGFSVCQLDCVTPDALDALLEFAYTATLTIRSSGMRDVLRGAQLLGIQCVVDACRDILGETAGEVEWETGEQRVQAEREREVARGMKKGSRRKIDRRRVTKVESSHHQPLPHRPNVNTHQHPSTPPPHPSPVQDGARSQPSTRPPSPEQEEHPSTTGQNGDRKQGRGAGRGSTAVNGEVHWPQERLLAPHPPLPLSDDRLSEDEEEMEGVGNGGVPSFTSAPLAEQGGATGPGGGGRKRKSQTPQQCPVCQKIIHGAGKLPRHMRTHTGEKPFECSTCGVRFTRNDKLKIHMRKHTGERPYPCPHCPARFLHSYDLKNHLSLHSGARPFECPLCHKAFAREDHLQRHRKGLSCLEVHTRARPRRGSGADHGEEGRRPHASAFHPRAGMVGLGDEAGVGVGAGAGGQMVFQKEADRERALALLGPHRLPYTGLLWRSLELGARGVEGEEAGGGHSPALQHARWEEEAEEEAEEEMAEEDEEDDKDGDLTQGIHSDLTQGIHSDLTQGIHSDLTQGIHSDLTQGIHSDLTQGIHSDLTQGIHSDLTQGIHSDLTQGIHSDPTQGLTQ